jgi:hypothetical protein
VKKSQIPRAGKGLYAKKDFEKGDFICWYMGFLIENVMIENEYYDSDYILKLPNKDLYICAEDEKSCYGRYINDSLSRRVSNCIFEAYTDIYSAGIKAKRKLRKGDELYISYGYEYWSEKRRYDKLKRADKLYIDEMKEDDSDYEEEKDNSNNNNNNREIIDLISDSETEN